MGIYSGIWSFVLKSSSGKDWGRFLLELKVRVLHSVSPSFCSSNWVFTDLLCYLIRLLNWFWYWIKSAQISGWILSDTGFHINIESEFIFTYKTVCMFKLMGYTFLNLAVFINSILSSSQSKAVLVNLGIRCFPNNLC